MDIGLTSKQLNVIQSMDLTSLFDIVSYFPYKYDDYAIDLYLDSYHHDRNVTIRGMVVDQPVSKSVKSNLTKIDFTLMFNGKEYHIICFNRVYLLNALNRGKEVIVQGKYNHYKKEILLSKITMDLRKEDTLSPVYRLKNNITSYEFGAIVKKSFNVLDSVDGLQNIVPEMYINKYRLVNRKDAYYSMHFPTSYENIRQANRHLKYEELLNYSLTLLMNREKMQNEMDGINKTVNREFINDFIKSLPFKLTNDQYNASMEIVKDIESKGNMYRLLQGDVGSGKTIVSTIALLASVSAGYQGAMMAPTDILAHQHYYTIRNLCKNLDIKIELLVSSLSNKEKKEIKERLKNNEIDIVIGTHAIIQDDVEFSKLGLVIIDEQHRFGVVQRNKLRKKGKDVDFLLMSATPIPRTLAISIYGDMDISTLHEFPGGIRDIETRLEDSSKLIECLDSVDKMVSNGSKMYVVCPLIEGDEKSVLDTFEKIEKYYDGKYKVYYVHGKMSSMDKERIIKEFDEDSNARVLVSTTVIEVGIDIKNTDIMILLGAERFGLAAIHQLRGRIGRHGQKGIFIMLSDDDKDNDRLSFMIDCNDGFEIARFDLQKRGPGDVVGSKQSGIIDMKSASLIDDVKILEVAREDAKYILNNKDNPDFERILKYAALSYNAASISID